MEKADAFFRFGREEDFVDDVELLTSLVITSSEETLADIIAC